YRTALQRFDRRNPQSAHIVDSLVRGMDRAPTEAFDSIVGRAMRDADSTLDTEARSGAAAFTRLRAGFLLLLVVIVAAAAAMSRVIIRGITGPVADAVVLAEKVAAGDLEATIVVDGTDEV